MKQQLLELKGVLNKKTSIERKFELVKSEFNKLQLEVNQAKETLIKETKDVDKLDGINLTTLFYSAIGKKDEKKDKEKNEMEAAKTTLKNLEEKLKIKEEEFKELALQMNEVLRTENQYNFLLVSVETTILSSNKSGADSILEFNNKLKELKNKKQQLTDTIKLLSNVQSQTNKAIRELESSESLGVFDLATDNLAISMMKRNQLDNAKNEVKKLKRLLDEFKLTLQKSDIQDDLQINSVNDSWMIIDIFMDNVFTDWTVLNDIQNVLSKVRALNGKLTNIKNTLTKLQEQTKAEENLNSTRRIIFLENTIMEGF